MLILNRNLKILLRKHQIRYLTTRLPSSQEIRQTYIDYFVHNHDHRLVRSSPVVPFCDPTVAFVNAGMNQVLIFFRYSLKVCHYLTVKFIRSSRIYFWERLNLLLREWQTHKSVYV